MPFGIDIKYEDDYYVGECKQNEKKPKKEIIRRHRKTDAQIKRKIRKWTTEETSLFYDALQQYGSNMDLIQQKMEIDNHLI